MSEPIAATVVGDRGDVTAPQPSDPALTLVFARGSVAGTSRTFACDQSPVTFGRAPENMLAFDAQVDTKVSHRHGRLAYEPRAGSGSSEDLGSTNGTYLNGEPVPRSAATPLSDGDELVLGDAAQFGVAARVSVGSERAATEPHGVDEATPDEIPPIPDEAGGGFFDGIKGGIPAVPGTARAEPDDRADDRGTGDRAAALPPARSRGSGSTSRRGRRSNRSPCVASRRAHIIARRADLEKLDAARAALDAEQSAAQAAMAQWLAEWENELAGATREADERQAKATESTEWVEELRRTLAKQLEPWREAAERVHKTSGALLRAWRRNRTRSWSVTPTKWRRRSRPPPARCATCRPAAPAPPSGSPKPPPPPTPRHGRWPTARQAVEQLRAKRAEREKAHAATLAAHRAKVSDADAQQRARS